MKRARLIAAVAAVALSLAVAPQTLAQYTTNFQINVISGVTSNWVGDGISGTGGYLVGSNTFADGLLIQSAGVLSNGNGYLGYSISSSNNNVSVAGDGSAWSNRWGLFVGFSGMGNSLVISNGGRVVNNPSQSPNYFGYVGYNASSTSNSVLVTGSNSVWKSSTATYIGYSGAANSLSISNGGQVIVVGGSTSIGHNSSSSNNDGFVSETGSIWSNNGALYVGLNGFGNRLNITKGGQVFSTIPPPGGPSGVVGFNSGSSNNKVVISDSNSVWNNFGGLYVGYSGAANSLVISNGGKVVDSSSTIGSGSSSNLVLVTGTGSVWNCGLSLFIGGSRGNSLIISNGGQVVNTTTSIGGPTSSSGNSVLVTDGGTWQNMSLIIDNHSNSVVIQGGSLSATNILVGAPTSLCDNLLQLDSGSVIVTNASTNATLEIRRGKLILNGGMLRVDRFVMTNVCAQFVRTGGTLIYGVAVLDSNRDDDGDGLPNGWEQSHGLDPLNAGDANADRDGDGFTNLQEFLAGTDPTNSASVFRVTSVIATGDDVNVTWTAAGGRTNVVQAAADLSGAYTNVSPNVIVAGSGETSTNYVDTGAATNAPTWFYRIRLVP